MPTSWQKQGSDPLFPNLIWSRPETKQGAGKLLIIGGQAQEFSKVAEAYAAAEKAGVGTVRVFLPESTRKVTKMLPNIEYAPSNNSGSFAQESLADLLTASQWADGLLLAGDIGKNSETSLMLEKFINNYNGLLFLAEDAIQSLSLDTNILFKIENTILIISLKTFQKFGIGLKLQTPITTTVSNDDLAEILHKISTDYPVGLVVANSNFIWTSSKGRVVATVQSQPVSTAKIAAQTSIWIIQNPTKIFEAITTAQID